MIDLVLSPQRAYQTEKVKEEGQPSGDRPYISLLKTVSWRVLGTLDTITISYIVTGEVRSALSIGGFEVFSKMLLYYFHERAWNKFKRSGSKN